MATQVTNYQCPACTGPLHFAGASGKLECEYCGSAYDVAEIEALYADKEEKARAASEKEAEPAAGNTAAGSCDGWDINGAGSTWNEEEAAGLRSYSCPSCGAEIVCDQTTAATACVYCGNPTVVPGQLGGNLKPDYVIPFKLDKDAAIQALKKYYKGKRLLPKAFSAGNHIEEIQGVYVPFWLFDGEAECEATYHTTRSHTHTEGDYRVTETEHFIVDRAGEFQFKRIPVDGSSKMPDAHMDSIEPYDYSEMKPFSTAYLPGYLADKYDVNAEECAQRANERVRGSADELLRSTVRNYESVTEASANVRIQRGDVKYAMMPVWMLHTKWQNKDYLFAMNGQTGKLIGDLPISKGRFAAWMAGISAPLMVILALLLFL